MAEARRTSRHAPTRFHAYLAQHIRTGGLLNYGEFLKLAQRAGIEIVSAARPLPQTEAKCARCGKKLGVAYRVGDALYGEKCAMKMRKGEP